MMSNKISMALTIIVLTVSLPLYAQKDFKTTPVLTKSRTITGQLLKYPDTTSPEITSVLVEIEPSGESGRHKHPVSPQIYVLQGEVTIEFDDRKRQSFSSGEAFIEAINTWHNAKNLGTIPVKMLVVFFGEQGKKNMIRP